MIKVFLERLGILIKQVTRFCQGVSVFESFVKSPVFSQMVGAIFKGNLAMVVSRHNTVVRSFEQKDKTGSGVLKNVY